MAEATRRQGRTGESVLVVESDKADMDVESFRTATWLRC